MKFFPAFSAIVAAYLLQFSGAAHITASYSLIVPSSEPTFAKSLDSAFVSFSLEFQFWPTYAGNATGKPNKYINQLLGNLAERTGKTPAIRVGGSSENRAFVDPTINLWDSSQISEVFGPFTFRKDTAIGRDWYVIAGNLPAGTEFTFGLNLYSKDEVVAQTKQLAEAFQGSRRYLTKGVTLRYVQVGNEPNFYFPDAANYTIHWVPLAKSVMQHLNMGGYHEPSFWVGSTTLTQVSYLSQPFTLTGALEAGVLDDSRVRDSTSVLEEHQYSGNLALGAIPGGPPPGTLMDKGSICSNLTSVYRGLINTKSYGKKYYIVGNFQIPVTGEGVFGLSNTAESAVWAVDYFMQLATRSVERMYFHSTPNRMFAVFQPGWGFTNGTEIERPHIMPMYNGMIIATEMIGTSGKVKVAELENYTPDLSAYGAWENGKLVRMVLINSNVFTKGSPRSAYEVNLAGWKGGKATIKRLSAPDTTATSGIAAFYCCSFETADGKPSGHTVEEPLNGESIVIGASEVVMITFK
ncbi:hypothetical protein F5884DRAFT_740279 [Xylogone sp. PMI_703]|nr:hypothetical protein F5884DRAFT_740279 [Xylogone sp. PMI_703]